MPFFGRRTHATTTTRSTHPRRRGGLFHRKDRDRVAGGYKAALANPNTTHRGRKHAKAELHHMGRSTHVPIMVRIKRTLGIRSTPRRHATTHTTRRSHY